MHRVACDELLHVPTVQPGMRSDSHVHGEEGLADIERCTSLILCSALASRSGPCLYCILCAGPIRYITLSSTHRCTCHSHTAQYGNCTACVSVVHKHCHNNNTNVCSHVIKVVVDFSEEM